MATPTRAEHVKLIILLLEQHKDELVHLYVKEQGKTLAQLKIKLINLLSHHINQVFKHR